MSFFSRAPRQPPIDPVPPALRMFAALMRSHGFEPEMIDGQLVFPFPVRGAFNPGDGPETPGLVCDVDMWVGPTGAIAARVWLPTPVPKQNHQRVMHTINEINARSMLGSWNLNVDGGDCWFSMWTYAVDGEVPAFVPEAMFGQIESAIDADVICRAAYGPS